MRLLTLVFLISICALSKAQHCTPPTQAYDIIVSSSTTTTASLVWANGSGGNRIVVVKAGAAITSNPVDNSTYTANTAFGSGSQIGTGNYVVYNSNGSAVTITGLTANTQYTFKIFEYNGGAGQEYYNTIDSQLNPISKTSGQTIIAIIGDSNSRGNSTAVGSTPSAGTVYQWDAGNSNLREITNLDLLEPVAASAIGSQWPQCGITYNALTGKIPVFINTGVGGTSWFSNSGALSWYTNGTLYASAKTKINNALAFLGVTSPDIVYINLGINDAAQAVYSLNYTYLTSLISRINSDWSNPRILITIPGKSNISLYSTLTRVLQIRKFIRQLTDDYSNVEICGSFAQLVTWGGYIQVDEYHANFDGNELIGKQIARQIATSTTNHKRTRSMVGAMFDPISATRLGWINDYFTGLESDGNLDEIDELYVFSDMTLDDKNIGPDWALLSSGAPVNSPTISFDGTTFNGTTQYFSNGVPSLYSQIVLASDWVMGAYIGTNNTAAGSTSASPFGVRENGTNGFMAIDQTSTSRLRVFGMTAAGSLIGAETAFASDNHYAVYRSGGNHGLIKGATDVGSAAVASSVGAASGPRGKTFGAMNSNGTVTEYWGGVIKLGYTAKYSTLNMSTFISRTDTFLSNWLTNTP